MGSGVVLWAWGAAAVPAGAMAVQRVSLWGGCCPSSISTSVGFVGVLAGMQWLEMAHPGLLQMWEGSGALCSSSRTVPWGCSRVTALRAVSPALCLLAMSVCWVLHVLLAALSVGQPRLERLRAPPDPAACVPSGGSPVLLELLWCSGSLCVRRLLLSCTAGLAASCS